MNLRHISRAAKGARPPQCLLRSSSVGERERSQTVHLDGGRALRPTHHKPRIILGRPILDHACSNGAKVWQWPHLQPLILLTLDCLAPRSLILSPLLFQIGPVLDLVEAGKTFRFVSLHRLAVISVGISAPTPSARSKGAPQGTFCHSHLLRGLSLHHNRVAIGP
jgi:hypothetical protein